MAIKDRLPPKSKVENTWKSNKGLPTSQKSYSFITNVLTPVEMMSISSRYGKVGNLASPSGKNK